MSAGRRALPVRERGSPARGRSTEDVGETAMAKGSMGVGLLVLSLVVIPAAAQAPPGMADQSFPTSLPADPPNAFGPGPAPDPPAIYGSIGYLGLERQRLGHGAA